MQYKPWQFVVLLNGKWFNRNRPNELKHGRYCTRKSKLKVSRYHQINYKIMIKIALPTPEKPTTIQIKDLFMSVE